ncbi:MAG: acetate--CoA ligase [Planctomycetia bacterium]
MSPTPPVPPAPGRGPRALESLLTETRAFPPPPAFAARAQVRDRSLHAAAQQDVEAFWAAEARRLAWITPFTQVLDWQLPDARWFADGTLNASVNCLDRHVAAGLGGKRALVWEGEPGDTRTLTYAQLLEEVGRCANALKALGVRRGDRVTAYMPLVPELAIVLLACARIGAAHSVVFGGFAPEALRERIRDSGSRVVVTADGGWRRGTPLALKAQVDAALEGAPSVERVLVLRRLGERLPVKMVPGRDTWWHELVPQQPAACAPEAMGSEDLLFLLYTSGTTGKPKGIVHTTGGYLTGTSATTRWVFDLQPDDVYWCTADIGWITGHSYVVYGPLANAATVVMYEGAPDFPGRDRFWALVARHRVSILYTAPTAIRTFMRWGDDLPRRHDLSSLRLLGSVGEPINPEAWMWYRDVIGGGRCPVVDTWWQTETGAIMVAPLPGLTTTVPGSATHPLPGVGVDVVDAEGQSVPPGGGGYLVLTQPWPSMLRGIHGDPQRYRDTYWGRFPGRYFTGDGCKRDLAGNLWLLGRVDDIMLVAGHNISTMEVESALVAHPAVAEAAVVGRTHEVKGQAIACFVTLRLGQERSPALAEALRAHVAQRLGALARPEEVLFAAELPKTRSGKIMRRLLRDVAEGRALGDTTTLADPAVVHALRDQYGEEGA